VLHVADLDEAVFAWAAASTRSASSSEAQSGFSIRRWQPLARSGRATFSWRSVGTTTETASQAAPSSSSDANALQPSFSLISAARAFEVS
jgi:hypothetical protein